MTDDFDRQRRHSVTVTADSARIQINEKMKVGRWWVNLSAERKGDGFELKVLDHLIVVMQPQELRDFASALETLASTSP